MRSDFLLINATCIIRGRLTKAARRLLPGLLGLRIVAPAANNLVFANEQDWELNNDLTPWDTVAAPPGFVRYDPDGNGNYHLIAGSPAIDRRTPMGVPLVDYNLTRRPQGLGVDIGPFEFVP
jgi:hypothetical protein